MDGEGVLTACCVVNPVGTHNAAQHSTARVTERSTTHHTQLTVPQVLYLTEAIDEATITNLNKFGDHELVDVSKEGLELEGDEAEKAKEEELKKQFQQVGGQQCVLCLCSRLPVSLCVALVCV